MPAITRDASKTYDAGILLAEGFFYYIYLPTDILQSIPIGSDMNLYNSGYRSVRSVLSF